MSKNIKGCFSHNSDDWKTPTYLYDYIVNQCGYIDLFPYCSQIDQYEKSYVGKKLFCNPPFSQMEKVVDYLIHQYYLCNTILLLCPARTDTKWFHKLLEFNPTIFFFKGRLHFNDSKASAPFPTILIFLSRSLVIPTYIRDINMIEI